MPSEPIDDIKVYHPASGFSTLPDFLSRLKQSGDKPVYIGFGSMEELGFFSSVDCVELLCILNEGTQINLFLIIVQPPTRDQPKCDDLVVAFKNHTTLSYV